MPKDPLVFNGKKFMWDGIRYADREEASKKMQKYKADNFEVELREEDGKPFLYTRRVVKESIVPSS